VAVLSFFAEGARRGERGLICSFHETPEQQMAMAGQIGIPFQEYRERGLLEVVWMPTTETLVDAWAALALRAADSGVSRVFVDSLLDVERLIDFPDRMVPFLTALVDKLRSHGVTSLFARELPLLVGGDLEMPTKMVAPVSENVILMRYVELLSQLRRLISVLKTRDSNHDTSIREFIISEDGIRVATTFESAEAVLTGSARLTPAFRDRGRGEMYREPE
jgi:circadian clock protein KaiC